MCTGFIRMIGAEKQFIITGTFFVTTCTLFIKRFGKFGSAGICIIFIQKSTSIK